MKILVTGGAGYIGSHTCKRLRQRGHEPIVFDSLVTGYREFVRFGPLVHGDIADLRVVREAMERHRPDAIIHFAASAYVGESVAVPQKYYYNNVLGTLNVANAAISTGVSNIVFSSSCATYGIPPTVPIVEASPQSPINPYGESKLFCETMLRSIAAAHPLQCTALRYFNAAGADPDGELGEAHDPETHVIPLLLAAAAGKIERFSVLGDDYDTQDGTCVRDYLHVTDLAEAHVRAVELLKGERGFDAINLGTGRGLSVRELVEAAGRVTGKSIPTEVRPGRPGDPPALVADAGKALAMLGWKAGHSDPDAILETAWAWMHSPRNPLNRVLP